MIIMYKSVLRRLSTSVASKEPLYNVKPFSEVPSPQGRLPFLGHMLTYRRNTENISKSEYKMGLFNKLGPIFKLDFPRGLTNVHINDPSAIEKVCRSEGKYPSRSPMVTDAYNWLYKNRNEQTDLPFQEGEEWRKSRSKLGKQLLPANVLGYCPGFNKISDRMIRNIQDTQDKDGYVEDIRTPITHWSLEGVVFKLFQKIHNYQNSATNRKVSNSAIKEIIKQNELGSAHFVLGADIDSRNDPHQDAFRLQNALSELVNLQSTFARSLPLYKIYPTSAFKRFNKAIDNMSEIGNKYASEHMGRIRETAEKGEKVHGMSLLEQWLIDDNMSEQEAVRNAITMMATAIDTTSNTTAFILYELAKHQDIQQKLYDQVTYVLGETGEADSESLQKIPYLGNIIKETMRFYAATPFIHRTLSNDIELLGYHIPANTVISFAQMSIGHNPQYFKDPHQYNPDRWSTDKIDPFAQMPFGFGPRGCWGRRFAEVEMKVLLSKICRQYVMSSDDDINTKLPYKEEALIRPGVPLRIKFLPHQFNSQAPQND